MNIPQYDEKVNKYAWCHNPMLHRRLTFSGTQKRIGASAFLVYHTLLSFCREGMDYVWPSMTTIEQHTGLSRNTVRKAIHTLETHRMVAVDRQKDAGGRDHIRYKFLEFWTLLDASKIQDEGKKCDAGAGQNLTGVGSKNDPYKKQEIQIQELNKYKVETTAEFLDNSKCVYNNEIQEEKKVNCGLGNKMREEENSSFKSIASLAKSFQASSAHSGNNSHENKNQHHHNSQDKDGYKSQKLKDLVEYYLPNFKFALSPIAKCDFVSQLAIVEYFYICKKKEKIKSEAAWLYKALTKPYDIIWLEDQIEGRLEKQRARR